MLQSVPPEKEGVVTRLGSYSRTVGPGVKWTLPAPFEQMRMEDVRAIRTMQIGSPDASDANFVLTRDQSIVRSEEHTSELQSLMRNSYAVFCLKTKTNQTHTKQTTHQ